MSYLPRASILVVLSFLVAASARAEEDLLKEAADGHRKAREAIRTVHVRMHAETTVSKEATPYTLTRTGDWLQSGSWIRCTEVAINPRGHPRSGRNLEELRRIVRTETIEETSIKDGRCVQLCRLKEAGARDDVSASIWPEKMRLGFLDLWLRAGFVVQQYPEISLLQLLERPGAVKKIERVKAFGCPCVHVCCEGPNKLAVEAWLSVDHHYLVKRVLVARSEIKPSGTYMEQTVDSFQECGQGIVFPKKCSLRIHLADAPADKMYTVTTTRFTVVSVNKPLAPDRLRLTIPEGTHTFDRVTNTSYKMGKDGNPSPNGPTRRLPDAAPPTGRSGSTAPSRPGSK